MVADIFISISQFKGQENSGLCVGIKNIGLYAEVVLEKCSSMQAGSRPSAKSSAAAADAVRRSAEAMLLHM